MLILLLRFLFFTCSYWVKLRLIKVQQTFPEATVIVVVVIVAVVVFVNVVVMALLVVGAFWSV